MELLSWRVAQTSTSTRRLCLISRRKNWRFSVLRSPRILSQMKRLWPSWKSSKVWSEFMLNAPSQQWINFQMWKKLKAMRFFASWALTSMASSPLPAQQRSISAICWPMWRWPPSRYRQTRWLSLLTKQLSHSYKLLEASLISRLTAPSSTPAQSEAIKNIQKENSN